MTYNELLKDLTEQISQAETESLSCPKCGGTGYNTNMSMNNTMLDIKCDCRWKISDLKNKRYEYIERFGNVSKLISLRYWDNVMNIDLNSMPLVNGKGYNLNSNIILQGDVGNGKTTIFLKWIFHASMNKGTTFAYVNYSDLVKDEFNCDVYGADILIIDDFGIVKNYFTRLFSVINSRYNNLKPTWVSVNANTEQEIISNVGKQIWDRIKDKAIVIAMKGESFRKVGRV